MKKCQFSCRCKFLLNKRDLRADGLPLQPPALRPRLLSCILVILMIVCNVPVYADNSENVSPNTNPADSSETTGNTSGGVKTEVDTSSDGSASLGKVEKTDKKTVSTSSTSLTLSVPTDALKLDLQPNNTFAKSSASSVSVKTDAFAGYTLSIKAKNNNELVNGNNKISSITGNLTEDQYKASGNTNTWGYQPSKINGSANTSFLPSPTTSSSTIEKTNVKNDTANNYNFVIGAKVDSSISNGTYSNTFVFTATANTVSYNITYNLNEGTWDGKSPQTGNTVDNTVKLDSNTPTRENFTFQGWCSLPTSDESCSGQIYQAGGDYPLTSRSNTVTLYAIWIASGECFTAGTLVDTPEGLKPIEDIEVDMTIYSYDINEDKIKEDVVEEVYSHPNGQVVKLTFNDGFTIQGTPWHFIYNLSEGGWDPLGIYQSGDTIQSLNGLNHYVNSVEPVSGQRLVYNLQTKQYNNFIIATSQNNKFLVIGAFVEDMERYYPSIMPMYN